MKLSSKTHCYACADGELIRHTKTMNGPGYEMAVDMCNNCPAVKTTAIGVLFPKSIIGSFHYRKVYK